jgi:hypothetical protein
MRKYVPLPTDPTERTAEVRRRRNECMTAYRRRLRAERASSPEARARHDRLLNSQARAQTRYRDNLRMKQAAAERDAKNLELIGL